MNDTRKGFITLTFIFSNYFSNSSQIIDITQPSVAFSNGFVAFSNGFVAFSNGFVAFSNGFVAFSNG